MKIMKNRIFIVLVAFAFGWCLSASAQDFSTGSDMMNSGSSYSSNVGAVGSTQAEAMYETTADYPTNTQRAGARKTTPGGMGDWDQSDKSPIGEPLVMLLFAAAAGAIIAVRRRKA